MRRGSGVQRGGKREQAVPKGGQQKKRNWKTRFPKVLLPSVWVKDWEPCCVLTVGGECERGMRVPLCSVYRPTAGVLLFSLFFLFSPFFLDMYH